MFVQEICIWLLALVVSTRAVGFRGFTYEGLKEPDVVDRKNGRYPSERWIQQPIDHFNTRDNRSWSMRYYENGEHFNGTGSMTIMLGGEWAIAPGYLLTGQMYDIAKIHGAMMYYTEHRYYGKSRPVNDTSPDNLQYLSVDQALADVAFFIETKKREIPGLSNTRVIVFGCSYAGNMAAWARIKYPHLIQGALASSAPVQAKADFFEYYETVTTSLGRYKMQCTDDIKDAFSTVQVLLGLTDGPDILKEMFNLCEVPDATSLSSTGYFMNGLSETFAGVVQYNQIMANNVSTISQLCDKMMDKSVGTPIMRLANILSSNNCLDVSYEKFVKKFTNTSWDSPAATGIMRLWFYQTCTEYGYYQTTGSSGSSIFGDQFPLGYWTQLCTDLYGSYYNSKLLDSSVRRTNVMYGGSLPDVENVIFVNGNIDPWHPLSVLEDLGANSPAILIDGTSHCADIQVYPNESPEVKEARKRIRSIINGWLTSS